MSEAATPDTTRWIDRPGVRNFLGRVLIGSYIKFVRATSRVWEGARGLEWTLPSPAPYHSFTEPPVLDANSLAHGDVTH